ncbi:hypothetical protein GCM10028825_49160 [Spirosoma agri]
MARPMLDYYELKGLLLKQERAVRTILSRKRFELVSSRKRPNGTLYTYKKENGTTQILIQIRKSDGLVSEIGWHENSETFGNLTHDAVDDSFVPVGGNSHYYNRFHNIALFVYYELADDIMIPCVLRVVQ